MSLEEFRGAAWLFHKWMLEAARERERRRGARIIWRRRAGNTWLAIDGGPEGEAMTTIKRISGYGLAVGLVGLALAAAIVYLLRFDPFPHL